MEGILKDLRYGARLLAKNPLLSAVAVLSLALGIGANTAIFSVVDAVLLTSLPYQEPDRLVRLWETFQGPNGESWRGTVSVPNLEDWQTQQSVFDALAGYSNGSLNLAGDAAPVRAAATFVTGEAFGLLGVDAAIGRTLTPEDTTEDAVVLSHGLWQSHYGGDGEIVGRTVRIDGRPRTVVGVMPEGFQYPPRSRAQVWAPLVFSEGQRAQRGSHWVRVDGRLRDGVTLEAARREMETIAARIAEEFPREQGQRSIKIETYSESMNGKVRPILLSLWGVVGLVLLIACGNVANLLLARAASRRREYALRSALGSSRWEIVRQVLAESLLLAVAGGVLGVGIGYFAVRWLARLPGTTIPAGHQVTMDGTLLGYGLLASAAAALAAGLVPALRASRTSLQEAMKEGGTRSASRRDPMRAALLVGEVALAVIVLVGASLLLRSFTSLRNVHSGIVTENVLTLKVPLPESRYETKESIDAFYDRLLEDVGAIAGVESAGLINVLPIQNWGWNGNFYVVGLDVEEGREPFAEFRRVGGDYFAAMSIPLLGGRLPDARDRADAPPVAVVNREMARRYFNGENPVGRQITFSDEPAPEDLIEIVGWVADVRSSGLDSPLRAEIYFPSTQSRQNEMSLVVKTALDPNEVAPAVERAVLAIDPEQPTYNRQTMDEVLATFLSRWRFNTVLFACFGVLALVLALAGVYGVLSYSVSQRTWEIGLRLALGARRGSVLGLITRQGMTLVGLGIAVGIALSLVLTRFLENQLYSVEPTDPLSFAAVAFFLLLVALAASLVPARRASRIAPTEALRYE